MSSASKIIGQVFPVQLPDSFVILLTGKSWLQSDVKPHLIQDSVVSGMFLHTGITYRCAWLAKSTYYCWLLYLFQSRQMLELFLCSDAKWKCTETSAERHNTEEAGDEVKTVDIL